ncbi:MAG: flavodoxin domain-containing protein [Patescibacteria group bacterium]|nr:flavodoxin domain-containing protein [Patescibacteria group bacterium]
MSKLIVYTSTFGNTKKIAEAIVEATGPESRLVKADELTAEMLKDVDFAFVGSPTIAWNYAPGFGKVFDVIKSANVPGLKTAAFDTGLKKWYAGDGAGRISKKLAQVGCKAVGKMRFIVLGKEGPLKDGEVERAKEWGSGLCLRV